MEQHIDYPAVQYIASPAETALMVKERILAINGANPVLLPFSKEPLPFPKGDKEPIKGKESPLTKLP